MREALLAASAAGCSSCSASTSKPVSRSRRIISPWGRWNSTDGPSASCHSTRWSPNWGRARRSVASSASGAEQRIEQRRAGEEDEPAARAQQPRGLRDPARRLAPQARAVLRQREVEARVGQRDVLGVGLDQRELDAVLRLHRARRRELALRLVDADRPRAAAGEPGREVGGAAAELDRVQAVEVGERVDLRLRDPPHAPGRLRARPVDLGGLDPAIGRAVPQLPVDLLVAHAASARPWA